MKRPWNAYSDYLVSRYGQRVYRVSVDAGLSCPNRDAAGRGGCAFCDGTGARAVHLREEERDLEKADGILLTDKCDIAGQIERGLAYIRRRYRSRLAMLYFQSWSNTNAPVERLKTIYDRALLHHDFVSLIVSTRPDLVPDQVCDLLASYITPDRDVWVELGLQSADDRTLSLLGRGHDCASYAAAAERLRSRGIKVCTHLMILPCYEGAGAAAASARLVSECGTDAVKIHNLSLCNGTRLLDDYRTLGCYPVLSLRRHVETVALMLANLDPRIIVERLLSEMTSQRCVNPRHFPDKREVLKQIAAYMEARGWVQGCLR